MKREPECRICGVRPVNEVRWDDGTVFVLCAQCTPKPGPETVVRELDYDEMFVIDQGDI